jgi:hypothetical protein
MVGQLDREMKKFTITMTWNEHHEQYLMKCLPLDIVLQEFSEEELSAGAKEVFYCGSVMTMFEGLSRTTGKKYKITVEPDGDA